MRESPWEGLHWRKPGPKPFTKVAKPRELFTSVSACACKKKWPNTTKTKQDGRAGLEKKPRACFFPKPLPPFFFRLFSKTDIKSRRKNTKKSTHFHKHTRHIENEFDWLWRDCCCCWISSCVFPPKRNECRHRKIKTSRGDILLCYYLVWTSYSPPSLPREHGPPAEFPIRAVQ